MGLADDIFEQMNRDIAPASILATTPNLLVPDDISVQKQVIFKNILEDFCHFDFRAPLTSAPRKRSSNSPRRKRLRDSSKECGMSLNLEVGKLNFPFKNLYSSVDIIIHFHQIDWNLQENILIWGEETSEDASASGPTQQRMKPSLLGKAPAPNNNGSFQNNPQQSNQGQRQGMKKPPLPPAGIIK